MKRNIIIGLTVFLFFSCGGNTESKTEENGTENQIETKDNESSEQTDESGELVEEAKVMTEESEAEHSEFIGHENYDPEKMKDWPSHTYRSDGYRPSVTSEWIKVIYTPDNELINTVLYWSTNDDTPMEMEIIDSEFQEGEISGWTGTLKTTDGFFEYGFGIIEDRFNLIYDDEGRMQEFFLEME